MVAWVTWGLCPFPKDDGPTARDLMMRYATNKKTTKRKRKLEKAMKVLKVRRGLSDFPSSWLYRSGEKVLLLPCLFSCRWQIMLCGWRQGQFLKSSWRGSSLLTATLKLKHFIHRKWEMSFALVPMQKHKKKSKPEVFNFSAIHLIHDPQGECAVNSLSAICFSLTGLDLVFICSSGPLGM